MSLSLSSDGITLNSEFNLSFNNMKYPRRLGLFCTIALFALYICIYRILHSTILRSQQTHLFWPFDLIITGNYSVEQNNSRINSLQNLVNEAARRQRLSQKEVQFSRLTYNTSTILTPHDEIPDPQHEFKPYNGHGVHTYEYVCFEEIPLYSGVAVDMNHVALTKRIVIYNSRRDSGTTLHVAASLSCDNPRSWPVTFRKRGVPQDYVVLPYPAYFITASQPGNLYHLLHDTLHGLYGILKQTNRLNSTVKNQVYTRKFFIPFYQARSKNISNFGDLITALGVRSYPVYHAAPPKVCHRYGVFGWKPAPMHEMAKYFGRYFNHDDSEMCKVKTLTFIDRQYRRVTNMDALLDAARSLKLKVQKVRLELMPFQEQYETIRCTDILVGVQGAGLQWAVFMRPKKYMIELAYPGWKFKFSNLYRNFNGMTTKQISGQRDGAEWQWLEKEYHNGNPLTQAQKNRVTAKFSNSKYDVKKFLKTLQNIKL